MQETTEGTGKPKNRPRRKRPIQTKTVSGQALENQQVYM